MLKRAGGRRYELEMVRASNSVSLPSPRARPRAVRVAWSSLLLLAAFGACRDSSSSEYVADQFADAYFRRFDQDSAMVFTALGATEMLDKELADTKAIRESGYTPAEAAANVTFRRGPGKARDARVDYRYEVTARSEDAPPVVREVDVELAKIGGAWKVVTLHFVQ
jgi:hypothetical protein